MQTQTITKSLPAVLVSASFLGFALYLTTRIAPDSAISHFLSYWRKRIFSSPQILSAHDQSDRANPLKIPEDVKTIVVTTFEDAEYQVAKLVKEDPHNDIFGFDLEWKPERGRESNKTAMLQLSGKNTILLIRLCAFEKVDENGKRMLPKSLAHLLEDKSFLLAGVGIFGDAKRLQQEYGVKLRGILNLYNLSDIYEGYSGGLAALCKKHLGMEMDKSSEVRCCNWERDVLSQRELEYAAGDAWAGREIFWILSQRHNKAHPDQKQDKEWVRTLNPYYRANAEKSDTQPREKLQEMKGGKIKVKVIKVKEDKDIEDGDWTVLSFEGRTLCFTTPKNAETIISKGVAVLVNDQLKIVQLVQPIYEHSIEVSTDILDRRCACCGSPERLVNFPIVPKIFFKYFQFPYRSPQDTVLLCFKCNEISRYVTKYAAEEFGRELGEKHHAEYAKQHRMDGKAITLCKTLRENLKIPRENYDKIRENIRATLELSLLDEVTEELIDKLASTVQKPFGEEYVRYGKRVVNRAVKSPEELVAFVQRWRRTFIDEMKPKFLADSWSINAPVFVEEQESD